MKRWQVEGDILLEATANMGWSALTQVVVGNIVAEARKDSYG